MKKNQKIICIVCKKSLDINDVDYESNEWPYNVVCRDCADDLRADESYEHQIYNQKNQGEQS